MTETKKRILSNVISLILGVGIGAGGYRLMSSRNEPGETEIRIEKPEKGGAQLNVESESGLKLTSTKIAAADYEDYGISPMAEDAYTLTVTVTPSNATNQAMDWVVSFANSSSAWATGKTVTQYVRVTPSVISDGSPGSESGTTATVECLQAFGEPIIIEVTSVDNPEATATCTVDYAKKITGLSSLVFTGTDRLVPSNRTITLDAAGAIYSLSYANNFKVTGIIPTPVYSAYTVDDTFTYRYAIVSTPQWVQTLRTTFGGTLNISETISTTPEYVMETPRTDFYLGRYLGMNVITASEVATRVNAMMSNSTATNTYLRALSTYATGYAAYPIVYFYVMWEGEYSGSSAYYGLKMDMATATQSVESIELNPDAVMF